MSKTPVSILQEYMTKRNVMPNYEILANSEGIGTHIPTFYYKVTADGLHAVGKGRSKKEAKHEAARLLLEKLTDRGHPVNMPNIPSSPIHSTTPDPGSPSRIQVNAIGTLTELCVENNIPLPQFQLIADVGPAHLRQFTVECKVATLTVTATDLTKKKARQTAAQKMLHRLVDTLPEFLQEINTTNEVNNLRAIEAADDVIKTFNELSTLIKKKTNWGIKISDSPKSLLKIMEEKNIKYEDLWNDVSIGLNGLEEILNKLDLSYTVEYLNTDEFLVKKSDPVLVIITVYSDLEFATHGLGSTQQDALYKALSELFNLLKLMTR